MTLNAQTSNRLGLTPLKYFWWHCKFVFGSFSQISAIIKSYSPSTKLLPTSPLSEGIISSRTTGTCSEASDTSYYNNLEPSRFCMLFSSLVLLSSIIFLELKHLRLATCSPSKATPCLQHPFPHSHLKPTFVIPAKTSVSFSFPHPHVSSPISSLSPFITTP